MRPLPNVGYLDDEATEALRSLYASMLAERGIPDESPGADELATRIVNVYLAGTTDAGEIRHMFDRPQAD